MNLPSLALGTCRPLCVLGTAWPLLVRLHIESQVLCIRWWQCSLIDSFFALLLGNSSLLSAPLLFTQFGHVLLGSSCRVFSLLRVRFLSDYVGSGNSLGHVSCNSFWIQIIQAWALLFVQFLILTSDIWSALLLVILLSYLWSVKELIRGEDFLACSNRVTPFQLPACIVFATLICFAWPTIIVRTRSVLCRASILFAWLRNWITTSLTHRWPTRRGIEVLRCWSLWTSYSWFVIF